MIRNSAAILMFTVVLGLGTLAQTPEPNTGAQTRLFSWTYDGNAGYLGVQAEEIGKENFTRYGLKSVRGVGIAKVLEGSPAEAAGIRSGDVIVRLNGEDITGSLKLTRMIGEIAPDHLARVTIFRSGGERDLDVTIGKRPMPRFENGNFEFRMPQIDEINLPQPGQMPDLERLPRISVSPGRPGVPMAWALGNRRQIGVGLMPLTEQLSDHFGVDSGTLVSEVRKDSPAEKAGLRAGDIIIEVNGKSIKDDEDIIKAINEKKEGAVTLTIVRDRGRQTITVTPEEMKGDMNGFFEIPGTPQIPMSPKSPGSLKLQRPIVPMPPDQLLIPGRVI